MRTTIDIPDEIYRELKVRAAQNGTTLRKLMLDAVELVRRQEPPRKKKFTPPVIPSTRTEKLELTNERIYDLIGFP